MAELILYGFLYIFLAAVAGHIAAKKGHSDLKYFAIGLVIPVIAIIIAITLQQNTEKLEERAIKKGGLKKCPDCAEAVKIDARICKHCGHTFNQEALG